MARYLQLLLNEQWLSISDTSESHPDAQFDELQNRIEQAIENAKATHPADAQILKKFLSNDLSKLAPHQIAKLNEFHKRNVLLGRELGRSEVAKLSREIVPILPSREIRRLFLKWRIEGSDPGNSAILAALFKRHPGARSLPARILVGYSRRMKRLQSSYCAETELEGDIDVELLQFERLTSVRMKTPDLARATNRWVKSEAHALYFYQHLAEFGDRGMAIVEYMLAENRHFQKLKPRRNLNGTFITWAFEKESHSPLMTLYYRPPHYSEAEWSNLSSSQRTEILEGIFQISNGKRKEFLDPSQLPPTRLKPAYLGGLGTDGYPYQADYIWEVNHHSYEISSGKVSAEMQAVSGDLKETHSFHVHAVFELPSDYAYVQQFSEWFLKYNRYLYFKGMEEGLHNQDSQTELPIRGTLPKDFEMIAIAPHRYKNFSAGLRGEPKYGESLVQGNNRLAIELRDVTRDMEQWGKYLEQLGDSLEKRIWEVGPKIEDSPSEYFHLPQIDLTTYLNEEFIGQLHQAGIDRDIAVDFLKSDPHVLLGLQKYETGKYFDYRTKSMVIPSAENARRIGVARAKFIKGILDLSREIKNLRTQGNEPLHEEIALAIKMNLSEWARDARVSELFSGI